MSTPNVSPHRKRQHYVVLRRRHLAWTAFLCGVVGGVLGDLLYHLLF